MGFAVAIGNTWNQLPCCSSFENWIVLDDDRKLWQLVNVLEKKQNFNEPKLFDATGQSTTWGAAEEDYVILYFTSIGWEIF